MTYLLILAVLFSATGTSFALCAPCSRYLALVPRNFRANTPLTIPLYFDKGVKNEIVTAKLIEVVRGALIPEEKVLQETTIHVPNGKLTATINLPTPSIVKRGSYRINVTATGSVDFHNSSYIYGQTKAHAIFIQTDKKKYRPAETVKYRIFVVNSKLGLMAPVFNVDILDPNGNKMAELTNQRGFFGIDDTFKLTSRTPLGSWRIEVTIPATEEEEFINFEVEKFVLPKFEVKVNMPSYARLSDIDIHGTVSAKYTFGKNVQGTVVLTASTRYGGGFFSPLAYRKNKTNINGEIPFSFEMEDLKKLSHNIQYETIIVHANVTETITGKILEGQANIRFHSEDYSVRFHENLPDNFKIGVGPYKARVKVALQDGSPPPSPIGLLQVTESYFTETAAVVSPPLYIAHFLVAPFHGGSVIFGSTKEYPIDSEGFSTFDLHIPHSAATASIKAEYKGASATKNLRRFRTLGKLILKSELLNAATTQLKIGDSATFRVTLASQDPGVKKPNLKKGPITAYYSILSRGQIVHNGHITISEHGQAYHGDVTVQVSRGMAPTFRFLVYYLVSGVEILADGLNLVVTDTFENKVAISFDQTSPQEPQTAVTLRVKADPGSVVNILAVDRSVQLLASGNDITKQRVIDQMNRFGDSPWFPLRGWGPIIQPWPISADDPADIFRTCQVNVFSDFIVYSFNLFSLPRRSFAAAKMSPFARGMAMESRSMGFAGGMPHSANGAAPTGVVRTNFPDTWLWKTAVASKDGVATFNDITPDTITKFSANAFALNLQTGLGVAEIPANMTVFLPFFVRLTLPYSVVRGEQVAIQAVVFNYLDEDHVVDLVLSGSDDFVSIVIENYGQETEVTGNVSKCVTVKVNQTSSVYFLIKPTKVGTIKLIVNATISKINRFDVIHKDLIVKADGIEKEQNTPNLIVHLNEGTQYKTIPINYPPELVPDSSHIQVSLYGDILASTFENLDRLIRFPSGCGEQNMVHFAPGIQVTLYLNKTNRIDSKPELLKKITQVLRTGYQRQLLYQRSDGSFSTFGNADSQGSLWLTAFVVRSLAQGKATNLMYIDPHVIDKAVRFIVRQQEKEDGLMNNIGIVSHRGLQGATVSSRNALSAYVLIALIQARKSEILEDPGTSILLDDAISKLANALVNTFISKGEKTDYELAIIAYALKLDNNIGYKNFLGALESSTNVVKEGNNLMYWKHMSRALRIEIAAYALLTYSTSPDDKDMGRKVLMWLVKQRNSYGGFMSTQDTVVALEALTAFAALIHTKNVNLEIDVYTSTNNIDGPIQKRYLTSDNHDVYQIIDFPNGLVDSVSFSTKGIGTAVIDVKRFFNIESETTTSYSLDVEILDATVQFYKLKVCASFKDMNEVSNMAIIEAGPLSGFEAREEDVKTVKFMKSVEMAGGRIVIYFDQITNEGVCVEIPMERVAYVANVKPASVLVYSYYETEERVLKNYIPKIFERKSLCTTCPQCCQSELACQTTK